MKTTEQRVPRLSDFPPDEREAIVAAIAAKRAARAVKAKAAKAAKAAE